jgi:hypothetical protein
MYVECVLSAALPVTYPLLPVSRCKRLLSLINTVLNNFKNLAVIFKGEKEQKINPGKNLYCNRI